MTGGKKRAKTTITIWEEDLDWGIRGAFESACGARGKRVGEMLSELMEQKIREVYGPGADRIIDINRRRYERRKQKRNKAPVVRHTLPEPRE